MNMNGPQTLSPSRSQAPHTLTNDDDSLSTRSEVPSHTMSNIPSLRTSIPTVTPSATPTDVPSESTRPSTTPSEAPSSDNTVTAQTLAAVGGAAAAASSVSLRYVYT